MEWMPYVHDALEYIEERLLTIENSSEVARHLNLSEIYLQKGFQILTGYTIAEYIRNRRLYQASLDVLDSDEKLTDIGLKYGFDSPDSFTRAFSRFHGINPSDMRKTKKGCRKFLPLKVEIQVKGGNNVASKTIKKYKFKVIGCKKEIHTENEKEELNAFKKYVYDRYDEGKANDNDEFSIAMEENNIGEFGIRKNIGKNSFEYMIAGRYVGGDIPEGMCVEEIPEAEWVIVDYNDTPERLITSIEEGKKQIIYEKALSNKIVIEWYENTERDKKGFRSALWYKVLGNDEEQCNGRKKIIETVIIGCLSVLLAVGLFLLSIHIQKKDRKQIDDHMDRTIYSDGSEKDTDNGDGSLIGDNVLPSKRMPSKYYLDFNSNRYYSIDIVEHYPVDPTSVKEFSYYIDKIVDYNVSDVGEKLGECQISATDNVPEYSEVLSVEQTTYYSVYEIAGVDPFFAIAVRKKEDENKFHVFCNTEYEVDDLNGFLNGIGYSNRHNLVYAYFLDEYGEPEKTDDEVEIHYADGSVKNKGSIRSLPITEKEYDLLLNGNSNPEVYIKEKSSEQQESNDYIISEEMLGKPLLKISVSYWLLAQWDSYVDVYEGGYVSTDIGLKKRYFFVGTDATDRLFKSMRTIRTSVILGEQRAKERERTIVK